MSVLNTLDVIIGYSNLMYGIYDNGVVQDGIIQKMEGAVSLSLTPEFSDEIQYYDLNGNIQKLSSHFTGGILTAEVSGVNLAREAQIMGQSSTSTYNYFGHRYTIPYVCLGCIVLVQYRASAGSNPQIGYRELIFPKCRIKPISLEANTKGETIEFQTRTLEFDIFENSQNYWKLTKSFSSANELGTWDPTTGTGTGVLNHLGTAMKALTI